jgi:hypothetical protein
LLGFVRVAALEVVEQVGEGLFGLQRFVGLGGQSFPGPQMRGTWGTRDGFGCEGPGAPEDSGTSADCAVGSAMGSGEISRVGRDSSGFSIVMIVY